MNPIAVIGTGLAGYTVAREFRKLDSQSPLVLISTDDGAFYSKPMLSNAFAQGKDPASLVNTSADKMAEQLNARIMTFCRVTGIDTNNRLVTTDRGEVAYSRLVIAWGADPIRLPLEGDAAETVLSVNDLQDYTRFREAIADRKRLLILGAGLIGSEFANDLANGGYTVHVADPAPQPLGRLLPAEAGLVVREALAQTGIHWHLGRTLARLDHADGHLSATLDNGETLAVDNVLSAVGLRPRTQLAGGAGLSTNRGIVVDAFLQTSADDIYALGDCAEVQGLVLPFVMPIMHAARALARTLAGERTAVSYPAMPVVVKTPACPTVVSPPPAGVQGRWETEGNERDLICRYLDDQGALAGFALTGAATSQKNALAKSLPPLLG